MAKSSRTLPAASKATRAQQAKVPDEIVTFLRKKDYVFKGELGEGACGKTVLLYDPDLEEHFVCKKYQPHSESQRDTLFENFKREIKILHLLHHVNVVRVFNSYLYPAQRAGFIVMEYVQGVDIEDFLSEHPEDVNKIFRQVIEGFDYLEQNRILHRDIRPQNVLVTNTGIVKIIDFGFGKRTLRAEDFDKSITLNWWCEPPAEFQKRIYDYQTELYFVGKLFEKIIVEHGLEHFEHNTLLARMSARHQSSRIKSFEDIRRAILSNKFVEIGFDANETQQYRNFSEALIQVVSKIEWGAKYHNDIDAIHVKLEELYKSVMLEKNIPANNLVARCFINGSYYFSKQPTFPVRLLKEFIDLLRSCSREKSNLILVNLQTKLDTVARYTEVPAEDVPF